MALNDEERRFVEEYRRTGNGGAAAVYSGVRDGRAPNRVAEDFLTRPHIVSALEEMAAQEVPVVPLDKDAVLADIYEVKSRAMEEGRYSEVINALKLVSDLQGLRTTKVEVTHHKGVSEMTDEELMQILEKGSVKGKAIEG